MATTLTIPLSSWADDQLKIIASLTESADVAAISGATLLGERAMLNCFKIPGRVTAGGGCRFFATRDSHIALNLSRPDDRALMPALFGDSSVDGGDENAVAERVLRQEAAVLVRRGRELGLAIAALRNDVDATPVDGEDGQGQERVPLARQQSASPLVVDLSALWAGPLASRMLGLSGARVVKVESRNRPDVMRDVDPIFFARLNGTKEELALDLTDKADIDMLEALIRRADVVIEAARPRALRQLGIDADALVREVPGLVWATITGHGVAGEAAHWVGFGDDCSVAGGLSAALFEVTGKIGFVGDAIADPLTGIFATRKILEQRAAGRGARLFFAMSGVVAAALAAEQLRDQAELTSSLKRWAAAEGTAFRLC